METLIIIIIVLVVAGFLLKTYAPTTFDKIKSYIKALSILGIMKSGKKRK
tara:strand:+ start:6368 stop:6517 length:150 start_codon:yes stop_codon:yes gene_type:complete